MMRLNKAQPPREVPADVTFEISPRLGGTGAFPFLLVCIRNERKIFEWTGKDVAECEARKLVMLRAIREIDAFNAANGQA